MRKAISLVLALALMLCGMAVSEETAAPSLVADETIQYTAQQDGAKLLITADAENVTFDVTENFLSDWAENGVKVVIFKAGTLKTTLELDSLTALGSHFNIVLNNAAEMDEGEAKAAAGVAASSARVAYLLVNEDGTTDDVAARLNGSLTMYVPWDGTTGSIRALTENGSGYQRTQVPCQKGYEDGMTTVTAYRLYSSSFITVDGIELEVEGMPAARDWQSFAGGNNYCVLELKLKLVGVPEDAEVVYYGYMNDMLDFGGYRMNGNCLNANLVYFAENFAFNSSHNRWELKLTYAAEYEGQRYTKSFTIYSNTDPYVAPSFSPVPSFPCIAPEVTTVPMISPAPSPVYSEEPVCSAYPMCSELPV